MSKYVALVAKLIDATYNIQIDNAATTIFHLTILPQDPSYQIEYFCDNLVLSQGQKTDNLETLSMMKSGQV